MGIPLGTTVPVPQYDGVFPYVIPVQPGLPPALPTNMIGQVGGGNWGPVNTPSFYATAAQAAFIWGYSAQILVNSLWNISLTAAAQIGQPEGTSYCGIRVTDGTDAAATIVLKDGSAGTVATLTAVYTGTDGNTATLQINNITGTVGNGGTVQAVVTIANRQAWVSQSFAAGNGSTYSSTTFTANLKAQVNGTNGAPPCPYFQYTSTGASVVAPVTTATAATGGLSGNTFGNSQATLSGAQIGANTIGAPTGMYALQGTNVNLFNLVGNVDLTQATTEATFGQLNSCIPLVSFPTGTSTATAIASRLTNNAISPFLILCNDFTQYNDAIDKIGYQYMDPACKTAAIISSLQSFQDPSNKPYFGAQNMVGTIRSGSTPYTGPELGQLQQNGILIITRLNRGQLFTLAHGMTSDAVTPIADTRMLIFIANTCNTILQAFVGEVQGPPPAPGQPDTDATRNAARNAIAAFLGGLANPNSPQIAGWNQVMDGTNNTQATVSAGFLYDKIIVETLSGIKFILAGFEVGSTVTVDTIT